MESLRQKRLLLTGASGTLGYNIARRLAAVPDCRVTLPVRRNLPLLHELGENLEIIELELSDSKGLRKLFSDCEPDIIIHCAASGLRPVKPSWFDLVSFNVEATLRLFETYCSSRAHHFVYVSTGLVYRWQGRPLREDDPIESYHPYGASKAAADLLLQAAAVEFSRPLTIVRPFAFTGLQDFVPRLFPSMLRAASSGERFLMTRGDQVRDFCAADDIARGILLACERTPQELVDKFNLGSGVGKTLRQLVTEVIAELGVEIQLEFGRVNKPANDPEHLVADVGKAQAVLGWNPTTRVSHAVWELAQEQFPQLRVREPERWLCTPAAI